MQYLLLIYGDETQTEEEGGAILQRYFDLTRDLRQADVMRAGEGLEPTAAATTVRVRDGKVLFTDGPFAETKEQLGGFYLIDVADLDEALAWAARIPRAETGCVEVRPVMDYTRG
jgi:hypothetical protein